MSTSTTTPRIQNEMNATVSRIDILQTIPILAIPAALYTAWGGLGAVIRTEVLQVFVLLFGTISVVILGMQRVGGLDELRVQLPSKMFNFFQPDSHANFPWTGVAFGCM